MRTPPESYLIFKAELKKAQLEKERLKKIYEEKLREMNTELARLKEQISVQKDLMKITMDYALKLEENLEHFRKEVETREKERKNYFQ